MAMRWQTFEDQVRGIATHIYGKACAPRRIAGSDIDGVIDLSPTEIVLIEITINNTLNKVRSDLTKLVNVRNALFRENKFARCLVVIDGNPTTAMIEGAQANSIDIMNHNQLAALFLEYDKYRLARVDYPFGSAVDPESGQVDKVKYVSVPYIDKKTKKVFSHKDIGNRLLAGHNVVVIGEYGSGKSRCVEQVFNYLSQDWGESFRFPIAVNLRECWGLEDADEIIRRHFAKLGLDEMKSSAVRAYNRKATIFLLDGFDEIGIQSWSSEASKIREVRAQALAGVQDAVKNSGAGVLITGREHYFSTEKEMLLGLGLDVAKVTILHVKEEFSPGELQEYFQATGIDVKLPDWLPRRPLICQTIAQLTEGDRARIFQNDYSAVDFWRHFMKVVCERDARINKSFNADAIFSVFIRLANLTRTKPGDVGPINPRELQEAFEGVVGALPVENAAVMLQRLPSLGRVDQDSTDRQFIDTYILDGLRATGVSDFVEADEAVKSEVTFRKWINPLQPLGQMILAKDMEGSLGRYITLAQKASENKNIILAGDVVSSAFRMTEEANFDNIVVSDGVFSEVDMEMCQAKNVEIVASTIDELILSSSDTLSVRISDCIIKKVTGVSSEAGLPSWAQGNAIEEYDSVRTMSRIRDAGLLPAHEVLVVILKKTFFQPGTGRKEEALMRGFESGKHSKLFRKVITILQTEGVLSSFKGRDGVVYTPNRAVTARMKAILDELKSSKDDVWKAVAAL